MPDSTPSPTFTPRGVRNNNPGNVRGSKSFIWLGQTGVDTDGFVINRAPEYGVRQILVIFHNYQEYHGLKTPSDLINRWAPATENNVGSYVADVCTRVGVLDTSPIDIVRSALKWSRAIVHHECGYDPYPLDVYQQGIQLAFYQR